MVISTIRNRTARQFNNGRELSAWLGLVPRQHSSGQRAAPLGISKRGDHYLRTLLIHEARAASRVAEHKRDPRRIWVSRLKLRGGPNVAAMALASKNARLLWALRTRGDLLPDTGGHRGVRRKNQLDDLPKVANVVLQC